MSKRQLTILLWVWALYVWGYLAGYTTGTRRTWAAVASVAIATAVMQIVLYFAMPRGPLSAGTPPDGTERET